MLPSPAAPVTAETLAHPFTEPFNLPVSPVVAAWIGAGVVLAVTLAWPRATTARGDVPAGPVASWDGTLSLFQWIGRGLSCLVLALVVCAGRLGVDDELENLAPALVVGAGWPLLVVTSITLGPVWRWFDPWDAVARALTRDQRAEPAHHVWAACVVALPGVWYLSAYSDPLSPRAVGAALAVYTVVTVAACLAVGRTRWLATGEPLSIVLGWMALLPRRRLAEWVPPQGAEVLLGVLAGGVLFGVVRRSELWGDLNVRPHAGFLAVLGLTGACAVGAAVLTLAARLGARRRAGYAVARAAVPAVAAIVLAVAMEQNRLTTSVQLLPGLLGDPLGRGWDLLGEPTDGLDPAPLGVRGLLLAQLALVVAGHLVGGVVAAGRLRRPAREPVAAGLAVMVSASIFALASH